MSERRRDRDRAIGSFAATIMIMLGLAVLSLLGGTITLGGVLMFLVGFSLPSIYRIWRLRDE